MDGLPDHGYHIALANTAWMQSYRGMKYTNIVSDAYFLAELRRLKLRLPATSTTTPLARCAISRTAANYWSSTAPR